MKGAGTGNGAAARRTGWVTKGNTIQVVDGLDYLAAARVLRDLV